MNRNCNLSLSSTDVVLSSPPGNPWALVFSRGEKRVRRGECQLYILEQEDVILLSYNIASPTLPCETSIYTVRVIVFHEDNHVDTLYTLYTVKS